MFRVNTYTVGRRSGAPATCAAGATAALASAVLTAAWAVAAGVWVVAAEAWASPAPVSPSTLARTEIPAMEARRRARPGRGPLGAGCPRRSSRSAGLPSHSGRALSRMAVLLRLNFISSPFLCVAPALPPLRRQHLALETTVQ